jgi:hypothetical protein
MEAYPPSGIRGMTCVVSHVYILSKTPLEGRVVVHYDGQPYA